MTRSDTDRIRKTLAARVADQHTGLRLGAALGLLVVSWSAAGATGLAMGAVVGLVAVVCRPVVAVAAAHAGLLVLIPEFIGLVSVLQLAAFELCLLAVIASDHTVDRPTVALTGGFAAVLSMGGVAVFIWADLFVASMFLVAVVGLLGYGINRYERVSLGLVDDSTRSQQGETP